MHPLLATEATEQQTHLSELARAAGAAVTERARLQSVSYLGVPLDQRLKQMRSDWGLRSLRAVFRKAADQGHGTAVTATQATEALYI
ncbi:hypothetical protein GCM10010284_68030 [Streptomyces rubiginosohelvolus]|nr:hypothetical protein GCM10010284_68030 [Streptomyces rubiginosohelvolus]